jgi:transposase
MPVDEALLEEIPAGIRPRFAALLAHKEQALRAAEAENRLLREELRLERIRKYGPAGEKLCDAQLELLETEPSVLKAEVEAEGERPTPPKDAKPRRRHPGRLPLPAHLPRKEILVPCEPSQCRCGCCGAEKKLIGYEESEELGVIPAQYYVRLIKREKRACPLHPEDGVATAPSPPKILPKAKASNELVVGVLVDKYRDHLPLYRQAAALHWEVGLELDQQTLCGWVMGAGELLRPLAASMRADLFGGGYIQVDETPVPVHTPAGNRRAWLWEYGRPDGPVLFEFSMSRGRAGPREWLKGYKGLLQHDDYAAYEGLGGDGVVHLNCVAHARRKFFEAHQLDRDDAALRGILETIKGLYAVESQARKQKLGPDARAALRQQQAVPILGVLKAQIIRLREAALPASAAAKACDHALGNWDLLSRYPEHGRAEIDNNRAEQAIRPVALGRKNWLHIGSEAAGPKVAAIASIFATCKRLGIDVRAYLLDVLVRLPTWPINRVAELTPMAWQTAREEA